jgi:hypothetical protein
MINFKADVTEVRKLAHLIPQLVPLVGEEVHATMVESGLLVSTMVAARIGKESKNIGLLQAAVRFPEGFTVEGQPLKLYTGTIAAAGVLSAFGVSASLYSNYVEFGTKAHMPPAEPIEYWVGRKFGLSGDALEAATWGVRWTIYRRGTYAKANFFLAWHYDGAKRKVSALWRTIGARVVKRWDKL